MRLIVSLSILCIGLGLSPLSYGQDKPQNSESAEKAQPTQPEIKPKIKVDTEAPSSDEKKEVDDEAFNIDSFFKKAEENAEKGFNCKKQPDPIS